MQTVSIARGAALLCLLPLLGSCVAGAKNAVNATGAYRAVSGNLEGASVSPAVGLEGLYGLTDDGIGLEGGFIYSEDRRFEGESEQVLNSNELFAGARKTWNTTGTAQPFVAAGANWMSGDVTDALDVNFSGTGLGVYVRGGVGFQFGLFQTGFDVRGALSSAKVEDESLSYAQAGIFLGVSF